MSKPSEESERRGVSPTERRSPHTSPGPDGSLIFGDRDGGRWQVYDRRSGQRRGSGTPGLASGFERIFINEAGEEWSYPLRATELIDETAFTLERQLASAVRRDF